MSRCLGFFPNPEPGETVFSFSCRCTVRSGKPEQHVLTALTGQRYRAPLLSAVPGYIGNLSSNAPIPHAWCDPKNILLKHTSLPYITYFLPPAEREKWLELFTTAGSPHPLLMSLGLNKHTPFPRNLRFCSECLQEQMRKSGFPYYKREHQLPGVLVCYEHKKILSDGCQMCGAYPLKGTRYGSQCMPGKCYCSTLTPHPVADNVRRIEPLAWLAHQSALMLNSSGTSVIGVREKLRLAAIMNGYSNGSIILYEKLATCIENRFDPSNLQILGLEPRDSSGSAASWLRRILQPSKQSSSSSLMLLVLVGALFESLQQFEDFKFVSSPSGTQTLKVKETSTIDWSRLKFLIQEKSIQEISSLLNVRLDKVLRQMRQQRLHLPLSTKVTDKLGCKVEKIREDLAAGSEIIEILRRHNITEETLILIELDMPQLIDKNKKERARLLSEKHRGILNSFLSKHPDAGRSDVMASLPGQYDFFMTFDKTWFYSRIPSRKKPNKKLKRGKLIDYPLLDREKSKEIKDLSEVILSSKNRPIRITKQYLLNAVSIFPKYHRESASFPKVTKVLAKYLETREQYLTRLITWAVNQLAAQNLPISIFRVRRIAGVTSEVVREYRSLALKLAAGLNLKVHPNSAFVSLDDDSISDP